MQEANDKLGEEIMKRVEFKNSRGLMLVGDWYEAENHKAIIMCHGFTGDRVEHGRFEKAAKAFHDAGFNVLKFDFSGSGESDDDPLTVDGWNNDLEAAIQFVKEQGMADIGLLGHSLGGLIALKHHKQAKVLAVWAPVTNKVEDARGRRNYTDELLAELDETGHMTYEVHGETPRKHVIIPRQMLEERESVDQKKLMQDIQEPVLIVHGDKDEAVPIDDSMKAVELLGDNAKLVVVAGGTHALTPLLDEFIQPTTEWFKENL